MIDLNRLAGFAPAECREIVVAGALEDVGNDDPSRYWEDVLGRNWLGPFPPHWCGAFVLHHYRASGLTDWLWDITGLRGAKGSGYLYKLAPNWSWTQDPEPGDSSYKDSPYRHHAMVVEVRDGIVYTVDGNSGKGKPSVTRQEHKLGDPSYKYASLAPLLPRVELST